MTTARSSGLRVLIVEDVELESMLLASVLADFGYSNVARCANATDALADIEKHQTRIVVTDHELGSISGAALTAEIRAKFPVPYVYVIMLSSRGSDDRIHRAFGAGVDDFVTKPYRHEDLAGRIRVAERIIGLETMLRTRSSELEMALRRIDVTAAQRALAAASKAQVVVSSSATPMEALVATPAWNDAGSIAANSLASFFQLPFESAPHVEPGEDAFVAHIILSDPKREVELTISVVADRPALKGLAQHLLGDGDDVENAEALQLEVSNILMGVFKADLSSAGFGFTGGTPVAAKLEDRMTAIKASPARARFTLRAEVGTLTVWIAAAAKGNSRVRGRHLKEGMVLRGDARDARGILLMRGGTRITQTVAERLASLAPDAEFEVGLVAA